MGFTKITDADLIDKGVIGLPDQPGLSTAAMQAKLEETARGVIIPKHNGLIDELADVTAAGEIGATPPTGLIGTTVQSLINELATGAGSSVKDAYKNIDAGGTTITASGEDTFKINAGSNVTITPLASPDKGIQISATGGGTSTGDMLMADYDSDGTVKSAGGIKAFVNSGLSGKANVSHTHTTSDITDFPSLATVATSGDYSDLINPPTIPSALSDLTDDSTHRVVTDTEKTSWNGKSTVSWNQIITTGQKIATVSIDGTPTDVYAPTGGGGGGGAVDSVNGQTGVVTLDINDINDVTLTGLAQNDALVRNGSNEWVNVPLPTVALTGSYGDLQNKPSLATVATSGSYSDLSNKPTIPTKVSDLTNDSGYQTASDVSTAIAGKEDKSALKDLAYIAKDGVGSTKVLQGDGTWVTPSSGGHTMISNSGYEATMITHAADPTDDDVASAYVIANWSNCNAKVILTTASQGADGIGTWEADNVWETSGVRTGWLWSADLYRVLEDGSGNRNYNVEAISVFDCADSETVGLLSWRIDDDVTNGGVHGGAVAFKFTGAIQNATGVKVGVKLVYQRTEVNDTGTILS